MQSLQKTFSTTWYQLKEDIVAANVCLTCHAASKATAMYVWVYIYRYIYTQRVKTAWLAVFGCNLPPCRVISPTLSPENGYFTS